VTKTDWKHFKIYDTFRRISERALRTTSTGEAPWMVVEGADERYRSITVGNYILEQISKRLAEAKSSKKSAAKTKEKGNNPDTLLDTLDLTQSLSDDKYKTQLEKYQGKLNLLYRKAKAQNRSAILVFEGWDAAGKGGVIRRITSAMDARDYQIIPIAAPTEEERAQHYLWRFWRHLPRAGRVTIFDRSWYGRVLVERVEKFCSDQDWMRAYHEINDFEEQLMEGGAVIAKFWLTISKQEQLKRFRERRNTPFKSFKITAEDWRNRRKWNDYERAVCDMIERTSTESAPWFVIPGNDKFFARIEVLKTLCQRVEAVL